MVFSTNHNCVFEFCWNISTVQSHRLLYLGKVQCDSTVTHERPKAQWKALHWLSGEHFWGPGGWGRKAFVPGFPLHQPAFGLSGNGGTVNKCPVEWIMMHMFTEWDFCSTHFVRSAKKEDGWINRHFSLYCQSVCHERKIKTSLSPPSTVSAALKLYA